MIELTSDQIPSMKEWAKGGKPGMTVKFKMISFTKITSGAEVNASGAFEIVEVEEHHV